MLAAKQTQSEGGMNSKLEELMALADEFASLVSAREEATPRGESIAVNAMNLSRAALQDALKAVVADAAAMRDAHYEIIREHANDNIRPNAFYISSAALGAARKS